jgi:hypothetical protein
MQPSSRVPVSVLFTSVLFFSLIVPIRYRTSNLLCTGILPGPKEQNPDEIQRCLRPIVSDLLRLWRDGLVLSTESKPAGKGHPVTSCDVNYSCIGHLIRVVLVATVCDKPAAHKIAGFASHSHTNFCTLCWISTQDKTTPKAFQKGGGSPLCGFLFSYLTKVAFAPRTDEEHR